MASETSKSAKRRATDPLFRDHVFVGDGIDLGAGDDGFSKHAHLFPKVVSVRDWDLPDGDAQEMPGVADSSFDFVHASHSLEHMRDPMQALTRWLEIVKPGGYLAITVPDWVLYERCMWPSKFNPDHKSAFTTLCTKDDPPFVRNVHSMCHRLKLETGAHTRRVKLLTAHYPSFLPMHADPTALPNVEAAIEIVIQRRNGIP